MKRRILLVILALGLSYFEGMSQGYFLFTAGKNLVSGYNNTGTIVSGGGGDIMVGFLWGPAATVGSLGTNSTDGFNNIGPLAWASILTDPNFHFATNATSGAVASTLVNGSGVNVGGFGYLAGTAFTVAGTTAGATYTIYCIGWNSAYADPFSAAAASSEVGWSNPFQYASGVDILSTPQSFPGSGMAPFVVGTPEPTASALFGLSAVLLFLRRRRH